MINRDELGQIMNFVAQRWVDLSKDPEARALQTLPSDFWMNSVGGKAGKGRWVTVLMYTENEIDAENFKEVLLRWQTKGMNKQSAPDLIQIGKKENIKK